jgi:hypothetical protein
MRNTHRFFGEFSSFVRPGANSVDNAQIAQTAKIMAAGMTFGGWDGTPTIRADCRRTRPRQ